MSLDEQLMNRVQKALEKQFKGMPEQKEFSIYWGKKNISIAARLIEEFLPQGGSVIDPFVGSGSTVYAAIQSAPNINVTGVDVNEQPLSQIRFNLEYCNEENFLIADQFLKELEEKCQKEYSYTLDNQKYIFQKCLVDLDGPSVIVNKIYLKNLETNKIECFDSHSDHFLEIVHEYAQKQSEHQEPRMDLELISNSRIAIRTNMKLSEMYSPLNFDILLWIRSKVMNNSYLKGLLSSVLHLAKYTDKSSQSQFPYWYPKKDAVDRSLTKLLLDKHKQIMRDKASNHNLFSDEDESYSYTLLNIPTQDIANNLPSGSQDMVITDPPYFDQVAYSEYLVPWEFFCGTKVNMEAEIVESNRKNSNKTRLRYLNDMEQAFIAVRDISKKDSLMFFYYKDARLGNIHEILMLLEKAGWRFVGQTHVDKRGFTYKQNTTKSNTVEGDCLMVFQANENHNLITAPITERNEADEFVVTTATEYVLKSKAATLSEIYDNALVKALYSRGCLGFYKSPQEITELLLAVFDYDELERKFHVKH